MTATDVAIVVLLFAAGVLTYALLVFAYRIGRYRWRNWRASRYAQREYRTMTRLVNGRRVDPRDREYQEWIREWGGRP